MKKLVIILLVSLSMLCEAQVSFTPFVGINSVRMDNGIMYDKGGNYALAGIEFEFRKKPQNYKRFFVSGVAGVSYLKNGYYESSSFALTTLFYSQRQTDLKMQFIQVPLELKLNWHPFVLIDDWIVFLGMGVSYDFLTRSHLEEKITRLVLYNTSPLPPPETVQYSDSRDITALSPNHLLFSRFELGMEVKRIHLAWRTSISLSDAYPAGLENNWKVPDEDSILIENHKDAGKIKLKYVELVVGYRFSNAGRKD